MDDPNYWLFTILYSPELDFQTHPVVRSNDARDGKGGKGLGHRVGEVHEHDVVRREPSTLLLELFQRDVGRFLATFRRAFEEQ